MLPSDRAAGFRAIPGNAIGSAVALSLVFASAAVANFSPRRGIGFVRSLVVMLCLVVVTAWVMGWGVATFTPNLIGTYAGLESPFWTAYRAAFLAIFLAVTVAFAYRQMRRSETKQRG
jgi:hypothetical protein